MKYVLNFDHRSDNGPVLVGPFDTRDEASAHVETLELESAVWEVAPLIDPADEMRVAPELEQ